MESLILLILGIFISVLGIINMMGNISTIHSYNRRKVTEEDAPKYGRTIGIGTLIIGISLILSYVLILLNLTLALPFVLILAIIVGLVFILYAQFKYNKGIF